MRVVLATLGVALATTCAAADGPGTTYAPELANANVVVRLHNGRSLTAVVDPEATQDQLWLRWENSAAVIRQRVPWSDVAGVELTDGEYLTDAFRRQLPRQIDTRAATEDHVAEEQTAHAQATEAASTVTTLLPVEPHVRGEVMTVPRVVRSLAIEARAAHWNADPAIDGVQLTVYPLDAEGEVVPVRGTVTAELVGDVRSLRKPQPRSRFPHFSRLGWWNRTVQPESFGTGGATLQLPFQSYDPEFDATVRSRTLLIVRLIVPGQGVFQASLADVWVRPFSPLRNRIEASTGRRYLPQELRGR